MQTCRGSHTHTLVTDPKDKANIYIYGSGTGRCDRAKSWPAAPATAPNDDPNTALFSIDVIKVPLAAPGEGGDRQPPAHLRRREDRRDRRACGRAATTGPARRRRAITNQCHDITVYPDVGLAAGACSGNGILLDISRSRATRSASTRSTDKNFAYWHSATFNNDGTKVLFTDEWGGGTRRAAARPIRRTGAPTRSSTSSTGSCSSAATTRCRRAQTDQENCVAHNGSLDAGARPRHHGPGVVPGRRVGVRLHRLGAPGRDRLLRSRSDRREAS